ncbi:LysR family transcriptional regulator [Labrys miyagiensis]|uniref:LysR family transcriptional regulator n=1 Tax=Labrys miyagiensis TaxID=346912 RepID=A0ABQ6CN01_9HYPH|nr:LysR family transcriptional regulator [Labrys miyagiensis]
MRSLQAFESAARTGSFVAAAGELHVSPAAISQLIRVLEDQIGRKLFHRINRRIVLTEGAREILPRLLTAFETLHDVSMDLASAGRRPRLIVSVPPSMANGWLPSHVGEFIEQHGPVDIALRGEEDPVPFERDAIDIRLSYGRFHHSGRDTVDIGTDAVYPVCSPRVLIGTRSPIEPADMLAMPLIHTEWGPTAATFPAWHSWFKSHDVEMGREVQFELSANSSRTALELAVSGLGVALGQGLYVADLIEAGQLVLACPHPLVLSQPYCITTTPRSDHRPIVVAFRHWLVAKCQDAIRSSALASTNARPINGG